MCIVTDDNLELIPPEDGLLVKKAKPRRKRYALAEILDSFAPEETRAEVDFGKARGEEIW